MTRRIVLAPQGLPATAEARERCAELLLRCGADLCRVIEGPPRSIDEFGAYIASIRDIRDNLAPSMVLLSRLTPARALLELRLGLERRVPTLSASPWVVYADPLLDPDCIDQLRSVGSLRGAIWDAPLWTDADGGRYLVLTPHLRKSAEYGLADRLRSALDWVPARSTFRSLRAGAPSQRPTLRVPALTDERPTLPVPKLRIA